MTVSFFNPWRWDLATGPFQKIEDQTGSNQRWISIMIKKVQDGDAPAYRGRRLTLDQRTGNLYDELGFPPFLTSTIVRGKCIGGLIANPIYGLITMSVNVARLGIDFFGAPFFLLGSGIYHLVLKDGKASEALKKRVTALPRNLVMDAYKIGRCVPFTFAIEACLLEGIILPNQGRAHVAALEYRWNDKVSHKKDVRHFPFEKEKFYPVFYLFFCFQPVHHLREAGTLNSLKYEVET